MRVERDSLGKVKVPNRLYGSFTQRSSENFQISGLMLERDYIKALGLIKKCSAIANSKFGLLDKKKAKAIIKASSEVVDGKHDSEFVVDSFQAGGGTPSNMNANEVIANLAIKFLRGKVGDYSVIHPNNDVNMAQSSNDVIPTAIRMAVLFSLVDFKKSLKVLINSFSSKSKKYSNVISVGRTHLEDAVPVSYGQVFESYKVSLEKCLVNIEQAEDHLLELGIGGTAIGTGLNTHPKFSLEVVKELRKTGFRFRNSKNKLQPTWSARVFVEVSNALRMLAIELGKICDDLRLLNSGPKAGLEEVLIPEVEPGSSIMPGKINPSVPECLNMICYQVKANDLAVVEGASNGQLQLNVMWPVIRLNLLNSISLLGNGIVMFNDKCVKGLKVNVKRCEELLDNSLCLATSLNPYLGYEVVAEVVKIALSAGKTIKQTVLELGFISSEDLDYILDPVKLIKPGLINNSVKNSILRNSKYLEFKKKLY